MQFIAMLPIVPAAENNSSLSLQFTIPVELSTTVLYKVSISGLGFKQKVLKPGFLSPDKQIRRLLDVYKAL